MGPTGSPGSILSKSGYNIYILYSVTVLIDACYLCALLDTMWLRWKYASFRMLLLSGDSSCAFVPLWAACIRQQVLYKTAWWSSSLYGISVEWTMTALFFSILWNEKTWKGTKLVSALTSKDLSCQYIYVYSIYTTGTDWVTGPHVTCIACQNEREELEHAHQSHHFALFFSLLLCWMRISPFHAISCTCLHNLIHNCLLIKLQASSITGSALHCGYSAGPAFDPLLM